MSPLCSGENQQSARTSRAIRTFIAFIAWSYHQIQAEMNTLEIYLALTELDHVTALNKLTDAGIISDHVVTTQDIAEPDATRARDWLAEQE